MTEQDFRRVLVAFASRHGSTHDIASEIGAVLKGRGFVVEVRPADEVTSLEGIDAVVLGSAIYDDDWLQPAVCFLREFATSLQHRPVWLFSSGPLCPSKARSVGNRLFPYAIAPLRRWVGPRGVATFAGSLDPETLAEYDVATRWRLRSAVGDYRSWEHVRAWANGVADALEAERAQAAEPRSRIDRMDLVR